MKKLLEENETFTHQHVLQKQYNILYKLNTLMCQELSCS